MKENDCLETPDWIISQIGNVDTDPCGGIDTVIGRINYSLKDDGLSQPWKGFVFCNPPFSQKVSWAEKMMHHGNGILLLPERASAPWFAPIAKEARHYWVMGKKINFIGGPSSNNVGSVMFLFGNEAFSRACTWSLPGHLVSVMRTVFRKDISIPSAPRKPE